MFRELSKSEAAKRGLPPRNPFDGDEIVWFESSPDIRALPRPITADEALSEISTN
jgi:hypothetical protein